MGLKKSRGDAAQKFSENIKKTIDKLPALVYTCKCVSVSNIVFDFNLKGGGS